MSDTAKLRESILAHLRTFQPFRVWWFAGRTNTVPIEREIDRRIEEWMSAQSITPARDGREGKAAVRCSICKKPEQEHWQGLWCSHIETDGDKFTPEFPNIRRRDGGEMLATHTIDFEKRTVARVFKCNGCGADWPTSAEAAVCSHTTSPFQEYQAELNILRARLAEVDRPANELCNINDTCRARGFDAGPSGKATSDRVIALAQAYDRLRAENAALREALRLAEMLVENYKDGHFAYCATGLGPDRQCDCGLDGLLADWRNAKALREQLGKGAVDSAPQSAHTPNKEKT